MQSWVWKISLVSKVSLPPVDLATARSQINQSYKYFGSQLPTDQTMCVFAYLVIEKQKKKTWEKLWPFHGNKFFSKLMIEVVFRMSENLLNFYISKVEWNQKGKSVTLFTNSVEFLPPRNSNTPLKAPLTILFSFPKNIKEANAHKHLASDYFVAKISIFSLLCSLPANWWRRLGEIRQH